MYDGATVCDSGGGAFVIQNFLRAARQVRDRFHTHMRGTCQQMLGAARLLTRQVRADRVGSCDM